jgi:hypothetical protein
MAAPTGSWRRADGPARTRCCRGRREEVRNGGPYGELKARGGLADARCTHSGGFTMVLAEKPSNFSGALETIGGGLHFIGYGRLWC